MALVSDARLGLDALNALLDERNPADPGFAGRARAGLCREAKAAYFAQLSDSPERPIRPERLVKELRTVLPDDAVIVADPGTDEPR